MKNPFKKADSAKLPEQGRDRVKNKEHGGPER